MSMSLSFPSHCKSGKGWQVRGTWPCDLQCAVQEVRTARQRESSFPGLGFASFWKHLSVGSADLLAFVPSQAADSRDMSRELQDVDLAEVKPLVEKGEVSGDAPSCAPSLACSYMGILVCTV